MIITGKTLFAFVDLKDPFMPSEIAGEGQPGPILSILAAKQFDFLFLFFTPHARQNAEATSAEVERRHPGCRVHLHELNVSDPKDYSTLMGRLAREVRSVNRLSRDTANYVCVSSGTAEMRTAWFILTATGILPATMLQIGSPAEPLFGAANVKEVDLETNDWRRLRDLVMPQEYFEQARETGSVRYCLEKPKRTLLSRLTRSAPVEPEHVAVDGMIEERSERRVYSRAAAEAPSPSNEAPLEEALQELNIFIGSAVMRQAAETAAIAASGSDLPILLTGETGTGKEVFARLVHRLSARRANDMVCINCAAIPKELVESHLFGHVKGAFTGASSNSVGKFEYAHGKTLFLDEIGELTPEAQAKLLRVLQDGEVEPLGSNKPKKVDVRIVAATNRDLPKDIAAGRFREDLFYRLSVVNIELPPLRKRTAEIPHLAAAILKQINQRYEHPRRFTKEALQRLVEHRWPGNVRELFNVLQRSVLFSKDGIIDATDLERQLKLTSSDPLDFLPDPFAGFDLQEFLGLAKLRLVQRAVEISGGNQTAAAGLLGMTKQAISQILKAGDNAD